jgi:hypothetical protein
MNYLDIYNKVFKLKNYNIHVINRRRYDFVLNEITTNNYNNIIDISSGRGWLIKYINELDRGVKITSTDLKKFNDYDVNFIRLDLSDKNDYTITEKFDMLSCLDVLEHIEEKHIDDALSFFTTLSENVCISVANSQSIHNGIDLHLIKKNKDWWDEVMSRHFDITNSFRSFGNKLYSYTLKSK